MMRGGVAVGFQNAVFAKLLCGQVEDNAGHINRVAVRIRLVAHGVGHGRVVGGESLASQKSGGRVKVVARVDVGVAVVVVQRPIQLVGAHAAGIQRVAEPFVIEHYQLQSRHAVARHGACGFGRVAFGVPLGFLVDLGQGEVLGTGQGRHESALKVAEIGVAVPSDIAGAGFCENGFGGYGFGDHVKRHRMCGHAVRVGQHLHSH